jgi:hypothetical protein
MSVVLTRRNSRSEWRDPLALGAHRLERPVEHSAQCIDRVWHVLVRKVDHKLVRERLGAALAQLCHDGEAYACCRCTRRSGTTT